MSSWEHIVATQIADGSVYPLSRFIDTELHEMDTMASLYQVHKIFLVAALLSLFLCGKICFFLLWYGRCFILSSKTFKL